MRCLTNSEIDTWLLDRAIPKAPYHGAESPPFYIQFNAPAHHRGLDALVRHIYHRIIPGSDTLIHLMDWPLYQPSEMVAITGIRSSHGEVRKLIETPGHVIPWVSHEVGISLFSLSASYAWSSYLYSSRDRTTLYNWEGEIFDFWSDSKQAASEMRLMLTLFDLQEINHGEQENAGNRPS